MDLFGPGIYIKLKERKERKDDSHFGYKQKILKKNIDTSWVH